MPKADRYPPLTFFHIPKSAGTSLTRFLRLLYGRDAVCRVLVDPADMKAAAKVWTGHFNATMWEAHKREGALTMLFLRDPSARLLSAYYFAKAREPEKTGWLGDTTMYRRPLRDVLRDAVDDTSETSYGGLRNATVRHLVGRGSIGETMELRLTEANADAAIEQLHTFNVLGVTEHMSDSRRLLLKELDVASFRPDVPTVNTFETLRTTGRHLAVDREEITEEIQQMIDHLTALDRRVYRAAQNLFESRAVALPPLPPIPDPIFPLI